LLETEKVKDKGNITHAELQLCLWVFEVKAYTEPEMNGIRIQAHSAYADIRWYCYVRVPSKLITPRSWRSSSSFGRSALLFMATETASLSL